MEEMIYAGITVVLLVVWFFLQGKAKTKIRQQQS